MRASDSRALLAAALIVAWSCAGPSCGGSTGPSQPPEPPTRPDFSDAGFEHDDAGRPILLAMPGQLSPGLTVALVYDETLDDPVARAGECLARVVACASA